MVDACNSAGIDAAVLHQRRGFRPSWFASSTPIAAAVDTPVGGTDVLVVSELDAARLLLRAPGVTKVVLNQHQYWTFTGGPVDYRHPDVAAVFAVSDDGTRYLRHAFPGLEPYRLHYAVDPVLFHPRGVRGRTIGYLATKGAGPRSQVMSMLDQRGGLGGWSWRGLSGLTQERMAESLAECAILATFSEYEGFQMLLTEAMASGAAVVGFDAGGSREFLTEQYAWPVPAGDMVTFAERIEEVVASWDRETGEVQERTGGAVDFVHKTYTLEREAADAVAGIRAAVRIAEQRPVDQRFTVAEVPRVAEATKRRVKAVGKALLRGQ